MCMVRDLTGCFDISIRAGAHKSPSRCEKHEYVEKNFFPADWSQNHTKKCSSQNVLGFRFFTSRRFERPPMIPHLHAFWLCFVRFYVWPKLWSWFCPPWWPVHGWPNVSAVMITRLLPTTPIRPMIPCSVVTFDTSFTISLLNLHSPQNWEKVAHHGHFWIHRGGMGTI